MNTSKIIKAYIRDGTYSTTEPITQGDYGYILQIEGTELPSVYRVDFSNNRHKGEAIPVYGNENGVEVPEELIATGKDIFAFYFYIKENFGKTAYTWKIPNDTRAQNGDREPTPTQQDSIDQLVVRSNEAVERAEQAKVDAETAKGKAEEAQEAAETAQRKAEDAQGASERAKQSAEQSAEEARQKADSITGLVAEATTLPEGSSATASYSNGTLTFGIPKGDKGDIGETGPRGEQGIQGPKGDKGDTGAQGERGLQGERGERGLQGERGEKGEQGDDYVLTEQDKQDIAELVDVPVDDVQISGTSIVSDKVANIPIADSQLGAVFVSPSVGETGLNINSQGVISTFPAPAPLIKGGTNDHMPIVPNHQHESVFYGLAKASGDVSQASSSNPVGTYTDDAKSAIRTMLDVPSNDDIPTVDVTDVQMDGASIVQNGVASIPVGTDTTVGVVRADGNFGTGVYNKRVFVARAYTDHIKAGTHSYRPITPICQHESVFYGLAKSAGDTTQSASSNAVGVYTESAKSAISEMLNGSVSVSGTTPTIVAKSGIRYVCGEVATLDITLPQSGIVDVVFESGSTATVLTITGNVRWANGFDPTSLDSNTTYEINIMDGLGVFQLWSTT